MYTSQEGELYVGQARALGAFGVLPKSLKPIELNQVLKALHLVPADRATEGAAPPTPLAADRRAESTPVAELLEDLFRQQRLALGAEMRDSYERVMAAARGAPPSLLRRTALRPAVVAAVVLGGLAALFAYQYLGAARLLQETTQRSSSFIASAAQLASATTGGQSKAAFDTDVGVPADSKLVELLEWTLNEGNTYGFDEIALSEPRAEKLRRFIEYAAGAGLSGRLSLRVHVGRFCMTYDADGAAGLAQPASLVTQCEQLGWLPSDAFALGRRQTLAFASIVMGAQSGTGIRVETASAGDQEPAVPYPAVTAELTAGEWNRVAAANHRIDFRFAGETPAGP
jgi:hypothetical protein